MKKQLIAGAAVLLAIGAGASWYFLGADDSEDALKLYGNVDIRQVSLAFGEQRTNRCAACGGRRQGARRAGSGRARYAYPSPAYRDRQGEDRCAGASVAAPAQRHPAAGGRPVQGAPAGGTGGSRTGPPGVGAPAADRRWHRRQGRQSAEPGCGRRATEGRQGRSGEPAQGLAARRHRPAGRGHRPGAGRTGGRPGRPGGFSSIIFRRRN